MKYSIRQRLEKMTERFEEVGRLLAAPEISGGSPQFRELSMEYARLEPLAQRFGAFRELERERAAAQEMLDDPDPGMRSLGEEEVTRLAAGLESEETELASLLIPKDPRDDKNIFLEVRAGTGGDEAAIFAGDLYRMYARHAEGKGYGVEIMSESAGEHGGFKEIIARVSGRGMFSRFKFEAGTHRVQRVPATEAQGRIHTSACTVAILPELDEVDDVTINPADLRTDTFRSSGAGGQHVNKTDSAVRITHIPSGIVVECQDERSQHKNRSRAMALLKARLLASEQEKQQSAQARSRKLQVGSGDRSERIRTYNFPQGRVTDHRINLTLYKLADVMNGDLDELLDALQQEHRAEQLAAEEWSSVASILVVDSVTGVEVELPVAGPGVRAYAFVIDWHIRTILAVAWYVIGMMLYNQEFGNITPPLDTDGIWFGFIALPAGAIYILYHPALEIGMGGRTPGKRMAGVRLVTRTGGTPTFGTHLIRNVFRLVDNFPIFYGLGLVMTMITTNHVRLGDLAAGTLLVYDRGDTVLLEHVRNPRLEASTAEIVNELLRRWDTLDTAARTDLARKVLKAPPDTDDGALRMQLQRLAEGTSA